MAFSWATDPAAVVVEPPAGLKAKGYVAQQKPTAGNFNWLFQQVAAVSQRQALVFEGIGHLPGMIGYNLDEHVLVVDLTITGIVLMCPRSATSGTITVDLLKCAPGGAPTSLYSVNPKPTLTCNGGYAVATFSGADLPDITTLAAGEILIARITSAGGGSYDLKVMVM